MVPKYVPHVVILGAGFGGLTLATELEPLAADGHVRATLVDRNTTFGMGFSMQWVMAGRRQPEEGQRDYTALKSEHVAFEHADIQLLDFQRCQVKTDRSVLPFDMLVLALGVELRPDLLPGLAEASFNLCDFPSVLQLKTALERFSGGTIAVMISSVPFKCPPMPYEYAFLIDELLEEQGVRDRTRLVIVTPEPQPMPIAGKEVGEQITAMLVDRGIEYLPEYVPVSVDPKAQVVNFGNGASLRYDLLCAVPPNRAPRAVLESGLAGPGGFVPVDLETLQTSLPNVYAIGDVASLTLPQGKPHPKAGVFAEEQARAVARQIIARVTGEPAAPYSAVGVCYVELGYEQAAPLESNLLAQGGPKVSLQPPSTAGLDAKRQFEHDRLDRWFAVKVGKAGARE